MATRPSGNPPIWSQTATYPAGADPWSGNATKVTAPTATGVGVTPETGIVGEYMNDELNVLSTWVEWLSFGSFSNALDAHVIETDSTGITNVAGAILGASAGAFFALTVTENSAASSTTVSVTNSSGGFGILASSNGTLAGVRGLCTGTGAGLEGLNVGGGGPGVDAQGNGAGPGIISVGGATGHGGDFLGGATDGAGVFGESQTVAPGVWGRGNSSGASHGVQGVAPSNDGYGVRGRHTGGAPSGIEIAGVIGDGGNLAAGVYGFANEGYGVIAESDTGNPDRSSLRIVPQNTDPGIPTSLAGDVYVNQPLGVLKYYDGSTWRFVRTSFNVGTVARLGNSAGPTTNNNSAVYTSLASLNVGSLGAGNVIVRVSFFYGNNGAATNDIDVRIAVGAANIDFTAIEMMNTGFGPQTTNMFTYTISGLVSASDDVELFFKKNAASAAGIRAERSVVEITYET